MGTFTKVLLSGAVSAFFLGTQASAGIITYVTTLSGLEESPANLSAGTGSASVEVDDVANTMRVTVNFTGLSGITTASHIHCCTATPGILTAAVATQVPTFTGFPSGVQGGTYDHTFDLLATATWNPTFFNNNGGTAASAEAVLLAGLASGSAYLNIHTNQFAGGEIRGFLTPAPEPSTGLLLLGPGLGFWLLRRRGARG